MKLKPIETKLMSESGSVFKPDDVAKDILQGIERWKFCISHGFGMIHHFSKLEKLYKEEINHSLKKNIF
jgi:hypothetical protein